MFTVVLRTPRRNYVIFNNLRFLQLYNGVYDIRSGYLETMPVR